MNHSETIQALKLKFVERHAAPYLPNSQAPENNGEDSVDGFSVQGDRIPAKVRISRLGRASVDYHPKVEGYSRFWVIVRVIGRVQGPFPFWAINNSTHADRKQHPETTFLFTGFIKRPSPTTSSFLRAPQQT
jgi:hypothetical protein